MLGHRRMPAIVAVIVFLFTWTLTTHGKYSASGDEPHYLIIAHSLVTDGDLDLANNYAQNDGRFFGHDGLDIGLHAIPARSGRVRSIHDVGLAVALAPVYAAGQAIAQIPSESLLRRFRMTRGLLTYSLVSLFLMAVTAAALTLVASGLSAIVPPGLAAALVVVAGISPPVVSHAFLVFPEAAALVTTCVVVWFSMKRQGPHDAPLLMVVMLLLGLLPWTHLKYVLYAPGLVLLTAWRRWPLVRALSGPAKAGALALFVAPQVALHIWTWREWGTLGGALTTERIPFSWESFKGGLAGLWFDRHSGLLAYAPLYWIVPACWWLTWKATRVYGIPFALLYVPAAAFVIGWWAGFAPAARYIAPAVPLLLVVIAYALRYQAVRVAVLLVIVPQLMIDAVVWQHPRWLWPAPQGNRALQFLGGLGGGYEQLLPGVQTEGVTAAVWWALAAATALSALIVVAARREVSGEAIREIHLS